MNSRNFTCWAVVLVSYGAFLFWGNSEPVTMGRTSQSAWGKLWKRAGAAPVALPGQSLKKPAVKRVTPPPPTPPAARKDAEGLIHISGCVSCAAELAPRLQRSIRVSPQPVDDLRQLPPGASRLAATPDVPADFEWPQRKGRPLDLLAQIRLSDVAALDEDGVLPKTGWLCFFCAIGEKPPVSGTKPEDRDSWKVVYFDAETATLHRTLPPKPLKEEFPPCSVRFWNEWTLPSLAEEPRLLKDDRCWPYYRDLCAGLTGRPKEFGWHHLAGYAQNITGPMRPTCELASNGIAQSEATDPNDPKVQALVADAEDWVLLLQVELGALQQLGADPEGLEWAALRSPERIYFWIRQADLSQRDFSQVWAVRQGFEGEFREDE